MRFTVIERRLWWLLRNFHMWTPDIHAFFILVYVDFMRSWTTKRLWNRPIWLVRRLIIDLRTCTALRILIFLTRTEEILLHWHSTWGYSHWLWKLLTHAWIISGHHRWHHVLKVLLIGLLHDHLHHFVLLLLYLSDVIHSFMKIIHFIERFLWSMLLKPLRTLITLMTLVC